MSISIADLQKNIDVDGDGQIDPEEAEILELLKSMDVDGDGTIGIRELVSLGNTLQQSKEQVGQLKKLVIAVVCLALVFCGVMFVVCFAAVEASKDSKPDDSGKLKTVATATSSSVAVSVDNNIEVIEIEELYTLSPESLKQIDEIGFQLGTTYFDWNVVGFEQTIEGSGDAMVVTVKFNLDGGDYVMCGENSVILFQTATGANIDVYQAETSRRMRRRALLASTGRDLLADDPFLAGSAIPNSLEKLPDDMIMVPMGDALPEAYPDWTY
jgi:hypothetical protein